MMPNDISIDSDIKKEKKSKKHKKSKTKKLELKKVNSDVNGPNNIASSSFKDTDSTEIIKPKESKEEVSDQEKDLSEQPPSLLVYDTNKDELLFSSEPQQPNLEKVYEEKKEPVKVYSSEANEPSEEDDFFPSDFIHILLAKHVYGTVDARRFASINIDKVAFKAQTPNEIQKAKKRQEKYYEELKKAEQELIDELAKEDQASDNSTNDKQKSKNIINKTNQKLNKIFHNIFKSKNSEDSNTKSENITKSDEKQEIESKEVESDNELVSSNEIMNELIDKTHDFSKYNKILKDWRVQKNYTCEDKDNYSAVLYVNDKTHAAILSFRGSDIVNSIKSNDKTLFADIKEVFDGKLGTQQEECNKTVCDVIKIQIPALKEKWGVPDSQRIAFSTTGHSLGAWLAEVALYYATKDYGYKYAKAVTFESPGTYKQLKKIYAPNSLVEKEICKEFIHNLDIKTYLSAPNLVNCANKHIGTMLRLYPLIDSSLLQFHTSIAKLSFLNHFNEMENDKIVNPNHYILSVTSTSGHVLLPMIEQFDITTHKPRKVDFAASYPVIENFTKDDKNNLPSIIFGLIPFLGDSKVLNYVFDKLIGKPYEYICDKVSQGASKLSNEANKAYTNASGKNRDMYDALNSATTISTTFLQMPDKVNKLSALANAFFKNEVALKNLIEVQKYLQHSRLGNICGMELKKDLTEDDKFKLTYAAKYIIRDYSEYEITYTNTYKYKNILSFLCKIYKTDYDRLRQISNKDNDLFNKLKFIKDNCDVTKTNNKFSIKDPNKKQLTIEKLKDKLNLLFAKHPDLDENICNPNASVNEKIKSLLSVNSMPKQINNIEYFKRTELEDKLYKSLEDFYLTVVYGLSGSGKTSLVRAVISSLETQYFIEWIDSSTIETLNNAFDKIYQNIMTDEQLKTADAEHKEIGADFTHKINKLSRFYIENSYNDGCIIVFDNVEHYETAYRYMQNIKRNPKIKFIVTIKSNTELGRYNVIGYNTIKLLEFSEQDAKNFLKSNLPEKYSNDSDINRILSKISPIAYKLKAACAYFQDDSKATIDEYLDYLKTPDSSNMETKLLIERMQKKVELKFNQKDPLDVAGKIIAWRALQYLAYLDGGFAPNEIMHELFAVSRKEYDHAEKYIRELSLVEMVSKKINNEDYWGSSMHEIVQKEVKDYCEKMSKALAECKGKEISSEPLQHLIDNQVKFIPKATIISDLVRVINSLILTPQEDNGEDFDKITSLYNNITKLLAHAAAKDLTDNKVANKNSNYDPNRNININLNKNSNDDPSNNESVSIENIYELEDFKEKLPLAQLLTKMAEYERLTNNPNHAQKLASAAEYIAENLLDQPNIELLNAIYGVLGIITREKKDFTQSIKYFDKSKKTLAQDNREDDDIELLNTKYQNMFNLQKEGKNEESISLLKELDDIMSKVNPKKINMYKEAYFNLEVKLLNQHINNIKGEKIPTHYMSKGADVNKYREEIPLIEHNKLSIKRAIDKFDSSISNILSKYGNIENNILAYLYSDICALDAKEIYRKYTYYKDLINKVGRDNNDKIMSKITNKWVSTDPLCRNRVDNINLLNAYAKKQGDYLTKREQCLNIYKPFKTLISEGKYKEALESYISGIKSFIKSFIYLNISDIVEIYELKATAYTNLVKELQHGITSSQNHFDKYYEKLVNIRKNLYKDDPDNLNLMDSELLKIKLCKVDPQKFTNQDDPLLITYSKVIKSYYEKYGTLYNEHIAYTLDAITRTLVRYNNSLSMDIAFLANEIIEKIYILNNKRPEVIEFNLTLLKTYMNFNQLDLAYNLFLEIDSKLKELDNDPNYHNFFEEMDKIREQIKQNNDLTQLPYQDKNDNREKIIETLIKFFEPLTSTWDINDFKDISKFLNSYGQFDKFFPYGGIENQINFNAIIANHAEYFNDIKFAQESYNLALNYKMDTYQKLKFINFSLKHNLVNDYKTKINSFIDDISNDGLYVFFNGFDLDSFSDLVSSLILENPSGFKGETPISSQVLLSYIMHKHNYSIDENKDYKCVLSQVTNYEYLNPLDLELIEAINNPSKDIASPFYKMYANMSHDAQDLLDKYKFDETDSSIDLNNNNNEAAITKQDLDSNKEDVKEEKKEVHESSNKTSAVSSALSELIPESSNESDAQKQNDDSLPGNDSHNNDQ